MLQLTLVVKTFLLICVRFLLDAWLAEDKDAKNDKTGTCKPLHKRVSCQQKKGEKKRAVFQRIRK